MFSSLKWFKCFSCVDHHIKYLITKVQVPIIEIMMDVIYSIDKVFFHDKKKAIPEFWETP